MLNDHSLENCTTCPDACSMTTLKEVKQLAWVCVMILLDETPLLAEVRQFAQVPAPQVSPIRHHSQGSLTIA